METTPKSLRLQVAIFGRTNVGKSSIMNLIANQDVAITSDLPGTTTDIVEKPIELLPFGPVTLLDTPGIDDNSALSQQRLGRSMKILDRAEVVLLITEPNIWTKFEDELILEINNRNLPLIIIVNKIDLGLPSGDFMDKLSSFSKNIILCSILSILNRDEIINNIKNSIISSVPDEYNNHIPLISDLIPSGSVIILITPIDLQAPKGRLILPQVQAIRDILDSDSVAIVVKEREYSHIISNLKIKPEMVICDSQVVVKMMADTPIDIKTTTFSILFSRFKGDLTEEVRGAAAINKLRTNDRILIAEACSHHSLEDDIARVKLPRWLRQYAGTDIIIDYVQGRDSPDNIQDYKVIIHCGGCMLTRNEKLVRINKAKMAGVPITNYGIVISLVQGVLERALSPFPSALNAYHEFN